MRDTVNNFIKNAKSGDVYRTGFGVGSSSDTFSITTRGSNNLQIRSSNGRQVQMNRENVKKWIMNGATLIKRT